MSLYFTWLLISHLITAAFFWVQTEGSQLKSSCFPISWQLDRVYVSSPNVIAVLDHGKKRTYVIRKEGLPDAGKLQYI
jgi:hypothetical protein